MKILLIYPWFLEERIHKEDVEAVPMGLYYIGATLRERGREVEILDWHDMGKAPERVRRELVAKKPDVIGMSIVHANRWGGIEIARIAREIDPGVKIVFGGPGASFLHEHLLTHFEQIDCCVVGEGEYSFSRLVDTFEKNGGEDLETIPGVAHRKDGRIELNPCAGLIENLDDLPDPSRHFTYRHVSLSRGCPGACTFCGSPKLWGRRVRFHSAGYFVDQLERLHKKGVDFFYVSDDTFALKKDLATKVCREIVDRKLNISWAAICRARDVDEEVLYWMRRAGCVQISYGIESGSEKIRAVLNKKTPAETIEKAFAMTVAHGILPRAYFIYGSPGETWETVGETVDLVEKIKPLAAIFYILDIFPGTALYDDYLRRSGKNDNIWLDRIEDILYFETDPELSGETVLAFGKKLRTEFHGKLPAFVESVRLADKEELYPYHADFLSRLAMTFSHGDYSRMEEIGSPDRVAEKLYLRSLRYWPDHRAFLGLGVLYQKHGMYRESSEILFKGVKRYPRSEQMHVSLGVGLMNMGQHEAALACFERFSGSEEARAYADACKNELNRK